LHTPGPYKQEPALPAEKVRGSGVERVSCDLLNGPAHQAARKPADAPELLEVGVGSYSAALAPDGATSQATTKMAKLTKAAAITSWLLRLNQRDLHPVNWLEAYLRRQC